jgi:hypothetical protein
MFWWLEEPEDEEQVIDLAPDKCRLKENCVEREYVTLEIPCPYGPLVFTGGFAPYHVTVEGVLTVNRVRYRVTAWMLRWPDETLDWQPAHPGKPDFAAFLVRRADNSADHGSFSARQKIEAALKGVTLPEDLWKQCEAAWLKNETRDAQEKRNKAHDDLIAQEMRLARYAAALDNLRLAPGDSRRPSTP